MSHRRSSRKLLFQPGETRRRLPGARSVADIIAQEADGEDSPASVACSTRRMKRQHMEEHRVSDSNCQPTISKALLSASISGRSASWPSGNDLASFVMKERGMSHGPLCVPATSSSVADRATGSIGAHMLQFCDPSML